MGVDSWHTAAPSSGVSWKLPCFLSLLPSNPLSPLFLSQHSSRSSVKPRGWCWRQHLGRRWRVGCNYPEIVGIISCHPRDHIRCKQAAEWTWLPTIFLLHLPLAPLLSSSLSYLLPTYLVFAPYSFLLISVGLWSGHFMAWVCGRRASQSLTHSLTPLLLSLFFL